MYKAIKLAVIFSAMTILNQSAWADFNDAVSADGNSKLESQDRISQNLRPHPKHHLNMNAVSNKEESHHENEGGKYIYVPHPKGNFLIKRYVGS